MKTRTLQRALSMLLTAAMVFNMGLTPVFATEGVTPPGVSGVCTHHTEHTEDCGYKQGTPCTHEHTDDCYTKELTCKLIEGDAPEIVTDSEATLDSGTAHTHGDSCDTKTDNCKHTHDDTCGYTPDSPCTFDAASCTQCSPGDKPAEKVCTCPPVDSGELVHGADCPLHTAPEWSEALKALIAMVDALPNADAITDENQEAATAFEAALTAYEALTAEDKATFETTKQYKKLMGITAILTNSGEEPQVMICICPSEGGSSSHTESDCPFYGLDTFLPKGRSVENVPEGVTVKQTDTYVWNIYANGNPIIIKVGKTDQNYSFIYIDANENGVVDEGENTPVELTGVYLAPGHGYFLTNSIIYGGCESADLTGDTSVTMESGKVRVLCGGGFTGNVDGTVNVTTKDNAKPFYIYGAASGNTGDVNLNISGSSRVYGTVFGGAMNGGTVGNTNIDISDDAWLSYVYGGAESGTTGDTNITIDSKNGGGDIRVKYVSGGGHGGSASAVSGDSTITVNKNVFYSGNENSNFEDMQKGGWIYGGGYAATSTITNSTINLNYDDNGEFHSYPQVYGGGNMGSITGNCIVNVQKNAASNIYCGGFTGNVGGTTHVNVTAQKYDNGSEYGVFGNRGDGNPNVGGESTVTYTNVGEEYKTTWAGFAAGVDHLVLEHSMVTINGNSERPVCNNLTVGEGSSLGVWGNPLVVTENFTGGGSIISELNGFLSVDGTVSGMTTLGFNTISASDNTEVKIVSALHATNANFKLANNLSNYTLIQSGSDWKAVKTTAVPLDITISGDCTYGKTIQVKVTATGDSLTSDGKVTLKVSSTELIVDKVFEGTKNIDTDKSVTFDVPLNRVGGWHLIQASFEESGAAGLSEKTIKIAKQPLTISGIEVPSKEYSTSTEVKIPFTSFKNATLTGYINSDSGAVLQENTYYAKLDPANLDAGENKKIVFSPDVIFALSSEGEQNIILYNKYYVPAPNTLTIDITKKKIKNIYAPVAMGSIALGQTLKDVQLQEINSMLDTRWVDPTTKPQIGNQTGYPLICTLKPDYSKNYEFDISDPDYDANTGGIIKYVRVGVNAESMRKDYYVNDGEKQDTIDLSNRRPYGESIAASDVTLTYKGTNPTENIKNVAFNTTTKKLTYTVDNISVVKKDMAVISFEVTAKDQPKTIFEVIISTVERPDLSSIDTAIDAAMLAKKDIIIDERAASSVKKGTKFVNATEMAALDSAIKTAENAKITVTTTADAEQAAKALDDAVTTFKATIKTGTYTFSNSGDSIGGGNDDGNNTIIIPPDSTKPTPPTTVETGVNSKTDDNGNATAAVAEKDITNAIDKAQKEAKKNDTEANGIAITLNVKTDKNVTTLGVTLTQKSIAELIAAKVTQVTVNNGLSTITLDLAALKALAGGDVILSISKADPTKLSTEAKAAIGNRPVFQFRLTSGGKTVSDFKGGRAGLQIPYTLTTTEQAGNLCGVYVDASGKVNWLEASSFDPITGMMLISAQHFSTYGIGYKTNAPNFTDVGTHWARNDIDFVVARGLLSGTSNTTFAPNTSMTRGMFVTALGRLAGVDTTKYQSTKFTDVAATAYYAPYVAWANANNIVTGTSDTTFSPDKAITRQEMAVMLVNYSKAIGYKLPSVHAEVSFVDAGSIANWAKDAVKQMQMAGILMGKSGNRFDPTATATRAEVSAMLRRYVELVVNTETAEGWAMNESGQWMYIENGKRITGKKSIDGTAYTFDQYGVTTALPPERKYGTHIVQRGDSFWSIARKYKVSMFELAKVNGKTIFSIIYTGDELKIPQQ